MTIATQIQRLFGKTAPFATAQAFSDLYDQSYRLIFRYIYGVAGGNVADVEDLTAETFVRAWHKRQQFSGDDTAAIGWLMKIARNLVIDSQRRQQTRQRYAQNHIPPANPSPEALAEANEQTRLILYLLDQLNAQQREMLVLRYVIGWRVEQIAKHLDLPANTVAVTIRRSLQRLRQILGVQHAE